MGQEHAQIGGHCRAFGVVPSFVPKVLPGHRPVLHFFSVTRVEIGAVVELACGKFTVRAVDAGVCGDEFGREQNGWWMEAVQ